MSFRTPRHPNASIQLQISFVALISISSLFAYGTSHEKSALPNKPAQSLAYFTDMAKSAGLTMTNIFGGAYTKKYIIETTGAGVAIFDYDGDGWPDIFIVNGTTLDAAAIPARSASTNHLYRNNHDGTFTDVTEKAGLALAGDKASASAITTMMASTMRCSLFRKLERAKESVALLLAKRTL